MTWRNDPVDVNSLPAFERVALTPVSARFVPYRIIAALGFWGPFTLIVALTPLWATVPLPAHAALLAGVLLVGTAAAVLSALEARRRAFALRDEDLIHQAGLVVQRTTVLPVCRIQHVETASGPLERAFGLMRLTCFTAGGTSGDLVLAGLRPETAEALRQHLLERIRARDDAPAASPPEDDPLG
ncbi:PH domain-containing protein [Aquisalimonas sp.]|uniref:PH domain-containing protein n=1 Tax=unclassified Aquisalimonas TaxID=2644645 RepID=UPI0025B8DCF7|nr:PH domain-containing protein [Aquisalimonas sp.]